MDFLKRFTGVIVSPSETMKGLVEKPRILFPILATALSTLIFYLARYPLYLDFLRYSMEMGMSQNNVQMSPEQLEAAMKIGGIMSLVTTPIMALFWFLFTVGIVFGLTKAFKGEGTFKQFVSVTGYAVVINILYYLISAVVSFSTGKLLMDASLANITNLFAPGIKGTFLYGVIRGIDLFSIWYYAVVSIGVVQASKLSKVKVYPIVFGIYLVLVLVGANGYRFM